MKVPVGYFSLCGHVHPLARAVADGTRPVPGTTVEMRTVPETLPPMVREKQVAVIRQDLRS